MAKRTRRGAVIGISLAALVAAAVLIAPHFWQVGRMIGPTCTIGVNGTAASVTFQGWTAPFICQQVMQQMASATNGAANVVLARRPSAAAVTPVLCRYVVLNDSVTVQDGDVLKIVGTVLCAGLATRVQQSPP